MDHTALKSSAIASVRYDHEAKEMHVEFKGGRTYGFADVPQKAYLDLRDAASPGAHFNTNVRGKFSPLT